METRAFIRKAMEDMMFYHLAFDLDTIEEPAVFRVSKQTAIAIPEYLFLVEEDGEPRYLRFETLNERFVFIRISSIRRCQRYEDYGIPMKEYLRSKGELDEDDEDYEPRMKFWVESFQKPLNAYTIDFEGVHEYIYFFQTELRQRSFISFIENDEDPSYIPIRRIMCIECEKYDEEEMERKQGYIE